RRSARSRPAALVGGNRPVLRKQTQRCKPVLLLIECLQRLAPCRLLAAVDFAQIQTLPLRDFSGPQSPALHHLWSSGVPCHPSSASCCAETCSLAECQNPFQLHSG